MSDDAPGDDQIVRTALRLLPVPPHGDRFWDELDRRLAAGDTVPAGPADRPQSAVETQQEERLPVATVVDLGQDDSHSLVPAALRRGSNGALLVAAVAAAVLVVVAGTALVRQRNGTDVDSSELAGSSTTEALRDPSSSTTSAPTGTGAGDGSATEVVMSWVSSLAEGDIDAAWEALGPASQQHWGSRADFEQVRSGLAEGYGAWSAATPDAVIVTPLSTSGGAELVVVTLVGTVEQEGTRQARADAFPVRLAAGEADIELYSLAGELELVVPAVVPGEATRPTVDTADDIVVVVPPGAEAPTIRLDDADAVVCGEDPATELTVLDQAPGQRCAYRPEGGIPAGERVLTVAYASPDGAEVAAESVLFEAA